MKWTSVSETGSVSDPAVDAVEVALRATFPKSSSGYAYIALSCFFAGLLGLLYRQLFAAQTRNGAAAAAIAVFVAAHGLLLSTILEICWRFPLYVANGEPVASPSLLAFATILGYVGVATYRCFESSWWDGVKSALAVFWATVEAFSVWMFVCLGYAVSLFLVYPDTYPLVKVEGEETTVGIGIVLVMLLAFLASLPLLLHAGVAAYARSR
jgi:hypothetical protein